MEIDPRPPPTRKRSFSVALADLALQTPTLSHDPNYTSSSPATPNHMTDDSYFPSTSRSRSTSPLKRARNLAHRSRPSLDAPPAWQPAPAGPIAAGQILPNGRVGEAPTFDAHGLLRGWVTRRGEGVTGNWERFAWGSAVMLWLCPGGGGRWREGICEVLVRSLYSVAPSLQALGLSDVVDSIGVGHREGTDTGHQLARMLPVRRAPARVDHLLRGAEQLLGLQAGQDMTRFQEGCIVLVDAQGRIRLALPLVDVDALVISAKGDNNVGLRAMEEALRSALAYLEEEKAWVQSQDRQ
ncbi:hypothetical protein K461DRAFT_289194 [Myriangium duriaei CBS 260.36]|uniref:Uncharacterized protein n=1 Tax=Myriangium duriaei CBS 260.36 TaxID=1168546 RepID=A0A9P4MRQ9_9PEZI|nr:hypothetical protein K461DRAFT_289194 [Myriangium duriaei CBS 260.36]